MHRITPGERHIALRTRHIARHLVFALLILSLGSLVGCGGEDDECPQPGGEVDGIQGVVITPDNCTRVASATVSLLHGSGVTLTTTTTPEGVFFVSTSDIPEEGRWRISVEKGPFNGEAPQDVIVEGGKSEFVVMKLAQ